MSEKNQFSFIKKNESELTTLWDSSANVFFNLTEKSLSKLSLSLSEEVMVACCIY